jgi:hypothetical protein
MLKKIFLLILVLITISVWLVPKEFAYLERVADDYGGVHGGIEIDAIQLKKIGSYQFEHHLLYSEFTYSFGNIAVTYHGYLSMIFLQEREKQTTSPSQNQIIVENMEDLASINKT